MGWHLARPPILLIVNYSENMELGHLGRAGAIIRLCGAAEMHCEVLVLVLVAFRGAISHGAACVCEVKSEGNPPRRDPSTVYHCLLKLNISHETNERDLS